MSDPINTKSLLAMLEDMANGGAPEMQALNRMVIRMVIAETVFEELHSSTEELLGSTPIGSSYGLIAHHVAGSIGPCAINLKQSLLEIRRLVIERQHANVSNNRPGNLQPAGDDTGADRPTDSAIR